MNVDISRWTVPQPHDGHYLIMDAAAAPPLWSMSPEDYGLGATFYEMVQNWSGWVHSRVEHVTWGGADSVHRHVSIDCSLRAQFAFSELYDTTEALEDVGHRLFYVPLSMQRKRRRVTRLTVRDESGAPVPILTRARSAYFGSATLAVAALRTWALFHRAQAIPQSLLLPPDVLADLDYIATRHSSQAVARWAVLPWVPSADRASAELELRGVDGSIAAATARGQSLAPVTLESRTASQNWRRILTDPSSALSVEFVALTNDFARNYLLLARVWDDGRRRRTFEMSVEDQLVHRYPVLRTASLALRPRSVGGRRTTLSARPDRSENGAPSPAGGVKRAFRCARSLQTTALRALAVKAKVYSIPAPALARCEQYHLVVEAPDGLQITGAQLRAVDPRDPANRKTTPQIDIVDRSVQSVHLQLSGVPQGLTGEAVISIRPRAWNVLVASTTAAVITLAMLVVIGASWADIEGSKAQAAPLLLALSGGLGFFVARRSESGLVTQILRGVRMLAFLVGTLALSGALAVIAQPVCKDPKQAWFLGRHVDVECAPDYLWFLAVLALLICLPLGLATWRAWRCQWRETSALDLEDFEAD